MQRNLGCTGHVNLARIKGFDEERVRGEIRAYINNLRQNYTLTAYCGCADGADLLFAEEFLKCGVQLVAVLPCPPEEFTLEHSDGGLEFMRVLESAKEILISPDRENRYVGVSNTIVECCDELLALWDGVETPLKNAQGEDINLGGTYDTVCRAKSANKKVTLFK